jgi:hypothetical protein
MFPAPKSIRRRFRFSLATVFVVVTAVAVFLGYELNIVRERQAAARWIKNNVGRFHTVSDCNQMFNTSEPETIGIIRQWLGDETAAWIAIPRECSPSEEARIKSLFPEIPWDELAHGSQVAPMQLN